MVASVGAWSVPTVVYATKADVTSDRFSDRVENDLGQAISEAAQLAAIHQVAADHTDRGRPSRT
jgi:hypothetical protein